ncbi:hypothetical protein IWQ62_002263 [Dispira parvispora]|uniref:Uncharacterized protein n=1 Tax=Dispira parvispora TaxID=1520584 RepID=A0A9W8E859_9FUNG|nr:hypothetical protein IWQ62_002263 [Dispira parvispora]
MHYPAIVLAALGLLMTQGYTSPGVMGTALSFIKGTNKERKFAQRSQAMQVEYSQWVSQNSEKSFQPNISEQDILKRIDFSDLPGWCNKLMKTLYGKPRQLLDAGGPGDVLFYFQNEINQWLYQLYLDYNAISSDTSNEVGFNVQQQNWFGVNPIAAYRVNDEDMSLDSKQANALFLFPRGQYGNVSNPWDDTFFDISWLDVTSEGNSTLLDKTPLLFALKNKRYEVIDTVLYALHVSMRNPTFFKSLLGNKGVDSFRGSYPLYFRNDMNVFGTKVSSMLSAFHNGFGQGIDDIVFFTMIKSVLMDRDYDSISRLLQPSTEAALPSCIKFLYGWKALGTYALAKQVSPEAQREVAQIIEKLRKRHAIFLQREAMQDVDNGVVPPFIKLLDKVSRAEEGEVQTSLVKFPYIFTVLGKDSIESYRKDVEQYSDGFKA